MKTKSIFLLTFLLAACLASAQNYIPLQQHMQGVSGAEKITNLAEVEADLGRFTNLSATTGILSTANAQTLNVTGNATVNGFNYTASPTLNGASSTESTSTSVVGGIWNGDFSEGEGASLYGSGYLGATNGYASLSNGGLGTSSISNNALVLNVTFADTDSSLTFSFPRESSTDYYAKILPSTAYKLSCKYKIESASATGTSPSIYGYGLYYSSGTYLGVVTGLINTTSSNTAWVDSSVTFTSRSDANEMRMAFYIVQMQAKLTIDDIKLEQVTTHTNNSTTPTVAYPVITGVSSEFVDQQHFSGTTSCNFSGYWWAQSFVPSQEKLSAVTVKKVATTGNPTGNLIFEIRSGDTMAASTVIASVDVEKAVWDAIPNNAEQRIPIFALLNPGSNYFLSIKDDAPYVAENNYAVYRNNSGSYTSGVLYYSTNNGASWSTASSYDLWFGTHYAENTRQITLTNSNTGTSTTVDWGDDGLPDGAVVYLYNGTMSWDSGTVNWSTYPSAVNKIFSLLTGADNILASYIGSSGKNHIFNGWRVYGSFGILGNYNNGSAHYYTLKIPGKYVKDVTPSMAIYDSGVSVYKTECYYSFDNSNWISANIPDLETSFTTSFNIPSTGRDVYLKIGSPAGSYQSAIQRLSFTATLDTSAIAPLLLAAGSNTINQSVNGGSYKANVAIKSVSGGFQTTLNEANKQLTVLRNAPRSYLETPDKKTNAIVVDNDELVSISGPIQVNGATIMNASTTPAYDIALPYNSGGAIGSSWNTYSETKYKNIISDVTEASYANIASRLAGVQSKMVTRKIPDAVKAKFFDAEIEWVTDVVSVTEELKTQVVEPVYEVVKLDAKVVLDAKATEEQLLTAEADRKIVSYVTKEVSVLRSPGEYPRQEFRGWKIRQGVDEATKKQLENLYFKPHPEPIADTAPEAYRVPEGFAWSKWVEESTIYQNWILPQIINELPKLRKRLEALEAVK